MSKPKISLIIPAWNEEKYISPTLESANRAKSTYQTTMNENVEIIVVDNDSTDKTAEIAKEYGCKIVRFKKHNLAAVRNAGAKKAKGEYIAFVDGDSSIITEDTFINIHKNLEKKEIFGGGSAMRPDKINSFFGLCGFGALDLIRLYYYLHLRKLSLILIYLRRLDFEKLNGFDETFLILEDGDFAIRMKKRAKEKNQKIVHLKKPVIVCTRKNKLLSFSKMMSLNLKIYFKKDAVKQKECAYDLMYDIDNLR